MSHDAAAAAFEKLYAAFHEADLLVQRRVAILSKWQALPDNEAKRVLVKVACVELGRCQTARAQVLQRIKEAELVEAEEALAAAQAPAVRAALEEEVQRLRDQLALVRAGLARDDADGRA